jgi:hypothetical protein
MKILLPFTCSFFLFGYFVVLFLFIFYSCELFPKAQTMTLDPKGTKMAELKELPEYSEFLRQQGLLKLSISTTTPPPPELPEPQKFKDFPIDTFAQLPVCKGSPVDWHVICWILLGLAILAFLTYELRSYIWVKQALPGIRKDKAQESVALAQFGNGWGPTEQDFDGKPPNKKNFLRLLPFGQSSEAVKSSPPGSNGSEPGPAPV